MPIIGGTGSNPIEPNTYWTGIKFIDGSGVKKTLLKAATRLKNESPEDIKLASNEFDLVWCEANTATNGSNNATGEGFKLKTVNGHTYTLNHIRKRHFSGGLKGNKTAYSRLRLEALVTQIDDEFGNWVKYEYDTQDRLSRIYSNDNRNIWLTYRSDVTHLVDKIYMSGSSNGAQIEKISYEYSFTQLPSGGNPEAELYKVHVGEGLFWQFNLKPLAYHDVINELVNLGGCDPTAMSDLEPSGSVVHPYGATGSFVLQTIEGATANLETDPALLPTGECGSTSTQNILKLHERTFFTAIKSKHLSGPGIDYQWDYAYSGYTHGSNLAPERQTTITGPENKVIKTYNVDFLSVNYNRLIEEQVFSKEPANNLLSTSNYDYTRSSISAGNLGFGMVGFHDGSTSSLIKPEQITTTIDNVTYTKSTTGFNDLGFPLVINSFNSLAPTNIKKQEFTYEIRDSVLSLPRLNKINNVTVSDSRYNADNQLQSQYKYGLKTLELGYHADGSVAWKKDGLGNQFQYLNYKRGFPRSIILPETYVGTTNLITYQYEINDDGSIKWAEDANGNRTTYFWDALKRLKETILPSDPLNNWQKITHEYSFANGGEHTGVISGQPVVTTTQGNKQTVIYHDGFNRPTLSVNKDLSLAEKIYQSFEYDSEGRETFTGIPAYVVELTKGSRIVHDEIGRILSVTNTMDNTESTYEYLTNNRIKTTDPKGYATTKTMHGFASPTDGYTIKIESPEGVTTNFTYTPQYRVKTITQSGVYEGVTLSPVRRYFYDQYNRLCREINPEGFNVGYGYDNASRIVWSGYNASASVADDCFSSTIATANRTNYNYDKLNQVTFINYPAGTEDINYKYDPDGNLKQLSTDNSIWNYEYNSLNQVKWEALTVDGQQFSITNKFDNLGNISSYIYPDGREISSPTDALGRTLSVRDLNQATNLATSIDYHANGGLKSFTYGNGLAYSLELNDQQLPEKITTSNSVMQYKYYYDDNKNISDIFDLNNAANDRSFTYDQLDRLIGANGVWGNGSITYDPIGNIRSKNIGGYNLAYQYDNTKNRLSSVTGTKSYSFSYDTQGNVTNNGTNTFQFDAANQMKTVNNGTVASMFYDGRGKRVKKVASGKTDYSLYGSSGKLMFKKDSDGNHDYVYLKGMSLAKISESDIQLPGLAIFANPNSETINSTQSLAITISAANSPGYFEIYVNGNYLSQITGNTGSISLGIGTHEVRARACNSKGCSGLSSQKTVSVVPLPAVPTISGNNYTDYNGSVTINWNNVNDENYYQLYRNSTLYTLAKDVTTKSISGLSNGTHQFKVRACNDVGCSAYSNIKTITVSLPGLPVINGSNYTDYDGGVTISWGNVSGETYYELYQNSVLYTISADTTSKVINNLSAGTHAFKIRACNSEVCSVYSNTQSITVSTPATPVMGGSNYTDYDGSVVLSWGNVSGESRFELYRDSTLYTLSTDVLSKTISGLASGNYTFKVRACSAVGCSAYSIVRSITVSVPGVPVISGVNHTDYDGSTTISWNDVANKNAHEIDHNGVVSRLPPHVLNITYNQLTAGSHQFKVRACNSETCGAYSNVRQVTMAVPNQPTITKQSSTVYNGNFTIQWSNVANETYYQLYKNNSLIQLNQNVVSQIFDSPSGSYTFKIRACNGVGCSGYSNSITITVSTPAQPSFTSTSASERRGNVNVSGSWSNVPNATYKFYIDGALKYSGTGQSYSGIISANSTYSTVFEVQACISSSCSAKTLKVVDY